MKLSDLIGLHELSAVDNSPRIICTKTFEAQWEDEEASDVSVNAFCFTLDGITYMASEDKHDGYRSYCNELQIIDTPLKFNFPPQKVLGVMKADDGYEKHDILQLIDVVTAKVVLEIGTGNTSDYYPYCVMSWKPENLSINQKDLLTKK